MTAAREAVYLPLMLLTVCVLGGVRIANTMTLLPPSLFSLAMQGIANGLSAIVGMGGGEPPAASPGLVLADSTAANAALRTMGSVPSNASLSKGADNGTPSPALSDDPYNPPNVDARVKPTYQTNQAHDTSSPLYNPKKTPEPADAQSAYQDGAVRGGMICA